MYIEQLNRSYGIDQGIRFYQNAQGIPLIEISNASAAAVISLYGGQLLSFRQKSEQEDLLFLSSKSDFSFGKAIRGGIPLCWPWFGQHPHNAKLPNHGFARTSLWSVTRAEHCTEALTRIYLRLASKRGHQSWPYSFELELQIAIGATLELSLATRNIGKIPFPVSQAFHAYFRVGHIERTRLFGLENAAYQDKNDGYKQRLQHGVLTVSDATDRIYSEFPGRLVIEDTASMRRMSLTAANADSAIVWNPWTKSSVTISDLESSDYQQFVCVEPAALDMTPATELLPNAERRLECSIKAEKISA